MKILITGGTGYIGSHTVVELLENGKDIIIVDNLSNSSIDVLEGIKKITNIKPEFVKLDLTDVSSTNDFFEKNNDIESIIHFAAFKSVNESVENPLLYYQNNLISLMNILSNMKKHNIKNLVFSSSCTVYGQPKIKNLPVTEKSEIIKANSPYGKTKQISEDIIFDTVNSHKEINAIFLRYFNPIGAHKSSHIGELPIGVPNNLVPFITQTAIGIRKQLNVFGYDYNTKDGSAVRDYINVVDLAKAHVISINRLLNKKNKSNVEIFNLGTGVGVSVLEAISTFEKATGVKVNYKLTERRKGDIEQVWADTSYANNELGWKAQTSLEDTMLSAWNWEKNLKNNK